MSKLLRPVNIVAIILLLCLQYRLWHSEGEFARFDQRSEQVALLRSDNNEVQQQNQMLYAEILDLRSGHEAIEERARQELGMIKKGETFFRIIQEDEAN
jgi:cell division protein FtsB